MEDPLGFSQKGAGRPLGSNTEALDADASPESGFAAKLGVPVWKQFVDNEAYQKSAKGAIDAEQNYQSQIDRQNRQSALDERASGRSMFPGVGASRSSGGAWRGENGLVSRSHKGIIEDYDASTLTEDPQFGALARKSMWDKEIRANKEESEAHTLNLANPVFSARELKKADREAIEAEGSSLQETDPRHKELKAQLVADDDYRTQKADLSQRAWETKNRASQLEAMDPEQWWAEKQSAPVPEPTPTEQRQTTVQDAQAKQAQAQFNDDKAAARMQEINAKIKIGVTGQESTALLAERADIAADRARIADINMGAVKQIDGVKTEAQAAANPPKDFWETTDVISGIWDAVKGLGTTAPAAFYQLVEGMERPDQYSESAKKAFAEADAFNKEMQAKTAANQKAGTSSSAGESFREAGGSLGFSIGSMAAAIPASIAGTKVGAAIGGAIGAPAAGVGAVPGAVIGGAIGGVTAGMAASGTAAYRMAGASFLNETYNAGLQEYEAVNKAPMPEAERKTLYEALLPVAKNTALWEAGPEAVGNAFMMGAGKIILGSTAKKIAAEAAKAIPGFTVKRIAAIQTGKVVGSAAEREAIAAATKQVGSKFLNTKLGKLTAGLADFPVEVTTEAVTQVEQSADQQKGYMIARGEDPSAIKADWSAGGMAQAFKEVTPQTAALMLLTLGGAGAVKGTYVAGKKILGTSPTNPEDTNYGAAMKPFVDTALASIDPEAAPAEQTEIETATSFARAEEGAKGLAEAVLIARDLTRVAQEDATSLTAAEEAVTAATATGDKIQIDAATANLETTKIKARRSDLATTALRISVGTDMSDLTDAQLRSVGYKPDGTNKGGFVPLSAAEMKESGLNKPLIRPGKDGTAILLDEVIKSVTAASPLAGGRIKMSEAQAYQKSVERFDKQTQDAADAAAAAAAAKAAPVQEFDVTLKSGAVVRVKAKDTFGAEEEAAATASEPIVKGSAKPVAAPAGTPAAVVSPLHEAGADTNLSAINVSTNIKTATGGSGTTTSFSNEAAAAKYIAEQRAKNPGATITASGLDQAGVNKAEVAKAVARLNAATTTEAQPGDKAKAGAKKRVDALRKSKTLSTRIEISEDPKVWASANSGIIKINLNRIIDVSIKEGMTEAQAAQYFARTLDEEIRHLAQYMAAEAMWAKLGSPGKYEDWRNDHYKSIWNNDFVATGKDQIIRSIYSQDVTDGKKGTANFDGMPEWKKAMEAIRMMSQGNKTTESAKLWANISDSLWEALDAALTALKSLIADIDSTPTLKAEVEALEEALNEIKNGKKQSDADTGDNSGKPPADETPDGNGEEGDGSDSSTPSDGETDPDAGEYTGETPVVGSRVAVSYKGKIEKGRVVKITTKGDRTVFLVKFDFPVGNIPAMRFSLADLKVISEQAETPPEAETPEAFNQVEYKKRKTALNKAINAGQWQKVVDMATADLAYFEETRYPDDWSDWERAKGDAQRKIKPEAPPAGKANPDTFTLPEELKSSSPRYGYGSKNFILQFASDYDKVAYILANDAIVPSAGAEKFQFAIEAAGFDYDEVVAHGNQVKATIKELAKNAREAGELVIPKQTGKAEEATNPARQAAVKLVNQLKVGDTVTDGFNSRFTVERVLADGMVKFKFLSTPQDVATGLLPEATGLNKFVIEKKETPPPNTNKRSLVENTRIIEEWFHNLIYEGKSITAKMVKEKGETLGITTKEAEEITEAVISGMMQSIAQDPTMTNEQKFGHIVHFYENELPSLLSRTSESKSNQAYSTPAPLAFVASILADIKGGKVVSESTFGHGILLMMAGMDGQTVQVNEIDPARIARSIAAIPGAAEWDISTGDATTWIPAKRSDRLISNPPFGKVLNAAGETVIYQTSIGETSEIDHAIMLRQLEMMTPDGRAVFIIGGPPPIITTAKGRADFYAAGKRGAFFKHLYDNYGVVDHMTLAGKLYAKQGAAYPVDIIVIQGKKSSGIDLPSITAPTMVSSWGDLFKTTELTDAQRIEQNTTPPQEVLDDLRKRLDGLTNGNKKSGTKGDRPNTGDAQGNKLDDQQSGLPPQIPDDGQGGNGKGGNGSPDGVAGGTGTGSGPNAGAGNGGPRGPANVDGERTPNGGGPNGGRKGVTPRPLTDLEKEAAAAFDDLFASPLEPNEFKERIPSDKIPMFMGLANKFIDAGVNTAEKLAEALHSMGESIGKNLRKFSDAFWSLFRAMNPNLAQVNDWNQAYAPIDEKNKSEPEPEPEPEPKDPVVDEAEKEKVNEFQDKYIPVAGGKSLETLAPKNLSAAMREALLRVQQRVGPLKEFVHKELGYAANDDISKYFAAEQLDALALAIDNFYQNGALIVGDQTGIGKGRVVAGLIKWTLNRGLIPVFVTKNPSLMNAMMEDDMRDIGMDEFTPAITNNKDAKILKNIKALQTRKIPMGRAVFETIAETGELPPGAQGIFTTYSQLSSDTSPDITPMQRKSLARRKQAPPDYWRMKGLKALSDRSVMILDESHLASGDSAIGYRFADLLGKAKHVYFSSATFAKRPESMAIYFRTNMRHVTEDGSMEKLIEIMQKGGVPAMQMASYMLAKDGQMLRRERDFDGVDFETVISQSTAENDIRRGDIFTSGLREIVLMQGVMTEAAEEVNEILKAFGRQFKVPAANRPKLESNNFSGKIHNLISQFMLAVKADAVIEKAREEIAAGRKVVVAVQSTMESGISRLIEEGRTPPNYKEMLLSHLDTLRTFKVGRNQEVTISRTGPEEYKGTSDRWLNDNIGTIREMPGEAPTLVLDDKVVEEIIRRKMIGVFLQYEERIEALDIADDLPLSPIDYMREKISEFGIITNEITGRGMGIDVDGETYKREIPGATDVMREFNTGDTHFLVINQSGSTGISLHDSEKNDNAGQHPRTMIVAQPNLDINEFMQMLGRIHRSGQKSLPKFILLQTALPSERRPAAVLGIKMAMLNANTTSNDSSAVSTGNKAVDIFNKYGDDIVFQHLMTDRDLVDQLSMFPVIQKDHLSDGGHLVSQGELDPGGFARRITGYLAVMPAEEQELFWERVTANYIAHIAYLDEIGENDLKAQPIDMKAKTLHNVVFSPGKNIDSIFAGESYIETVEGIFGKPPASGQEASRAKQVMTDEKYDTKSSFARVAKAKLEELIAAKQTKSNMTPEKIREWAAAQQLLQTTTNDALDKMGKWLEYKRDDGSVGMAIIESVSINDKSPFAPSAQTFKLLLNDTKHSIRVPATQMDKYSVPSKGILNQSAWEMTTDNNTTRSIVTGNLLAALDKLDGSGKVIQYTKDNGDTEMGIMLPSDFTKQEGRKRDARTPVTTAEEFIGKLSTGGKILNSDESLRVMKTKRGEFSIRVPAKRSTGGKFWRNPSFTALLERPMEDGGSWSVSSIAEKDLAAMFEVIKGIGETLSAEKGRNKGDDPEADAEDNTDPDDDGGGDNLNASPLRADSPEWKAMSKDERKAYLADRGVKKVRPSKRNALRVRLTREALTVAALSQSDWKHWYDTHKETLDDFFGDHADMFQKFLVATSQQATVNGNVTMALKAFGQWVRGEEFTGYLAGVINNLNKIRDNTEVGGQKISEYQRANDGDQNAVVTDRHIARMLFGTTNPSPAQFAKAKKIITEIAADMGWTPQQVQASLWAASIVKSGKTPTGYADYLKRLEAEDGIHSRIGNAPQGSAGRDGISGGRGRFAPQGTGNGEGGGLNASPLGESKIKRPFSPVVRDLLNRLGNGDKISRETLDRAVKENFPSSRIKVPKSMSELPSQREVLAAVNSGQRKSHTETMKKGLPKHGSPLTVRQDVTAQTDKGVGVVTTVTTNGTLYRPSTRLSNPVFKPNEKQTLKIGMGANKGPHIAIKGMWMDDQSMPTDLESWTQVGFNPDRHSYYYERGTERLVIRGTEAFQIGNTVFVKEAKFGNSDDALYASPLRSENEPQTAANIIALAKELDPVGFKAAVKDWKDHIKRSEADGIMYSDVLKGDKITLAAQSVLVKFADKDPRAMRMLDGYGEDQFSRLNASPLGKYDRETAIRNKEVFAKRFENFKPEVGVENIKIGWQRPSDGKFVDTGVHHNFHREDGGNQLGDPIEIGYVRIVKEGKDLYYEGKPNPKQLRELKDTSIELGLTLVADDSLNASPLEYPPQRDAEYLELAKDPEKNFGALVDMVKEAAEFWGFNSGQVFHNSKSKTRFDVFDFDLAEHIGMHFGTAEQATKVASGEKYEAFVTTGRSLRVADGGQFIDGWIISVQEAFEEMTGRSFYEQFESIMTGDDESGELRRFLIKEGYDSIIYQNTGETSTSGFKLEASNGIDVVRKYDDSVIILQPSDIKSSSPVTYDKNGKVIPLSKRFDTHEDSILYSSPLGQNADENIDALRIRGRAKINPELAEEARGTQEDFDVPGDRVVGAPRLANPGDTLQSREEQMLVDGLYEHDREVRKDVDVIAEGRRRFLSDPKGVEEKVLTSAYDNGDPLSDADIVAVRLLINQRAESAGNDVAKHEENMVLRMAYRLSRAETARSLRIGFDMFQSPEERAREFLTEAIYSPSNNIEKKSKNDNWSPQQRRQYVNAASKTRLAQIEKAFADMGVTLDEALSGKAYLSLSKSKIMEGVTENRSPAEKMAIEMLQKKSPIARIRKVTGLSEEKITALNKALYDELMEKARDKVRGGSTLSSYSDNDGLSASPLTAEQIEEEARRIVEIGFGISPEVSQNSASKPKKLKNANPLTADWRRPFFWDEMKKYSFDTTDRADIMSAITEIRALAAATGKIKKVTGTDRVKAIKHLATIQKILAKHGTSIQEIFNSETPVADYRFDIRDRQQVAILARVIQAIDSDSVDKVIEFAYGSILSGIQTMTVNALAAIPAAWDMTVGRGFEIAVNQMFRDDRSASAAEVKYILRAAIPSLSRAMTNAAATWGSETPMFEEDFLGKQSDIGKLFDGHAPKIGVIGGFKGRIIRTPMRILLATDEFNRTAIAAMEIGAMAYRLAKAKKLVPGTAKFERFMKVQVNTPGSFASKLAADKASKLIFTNALPGQMNPVTGKMVPKEGIGDVAGMIAGGVSSLVNAEVDNIVAKAMLASLRLFFFPFQRTPFNLIRRGIRHTLNPISMIDIGILFAKNSYALDPRTGHHHWKWNGNGRNAEIVERLGQQLQGAMLLALLIACSSGEGDDDDQDKPLLITGSQPFTLKGKAQRDTQYRAGLGPYRISFRKNGMERFGFNYGRIEPFATTIAATIDLAKSIKQSLRSGKGYSDAATAAIGGLVAQTQDKSYMQGVSDLIKLGNHMTESDVELSNDKQLRQFAASRFGMFIPNIIKQPIRESDDNFRERADTFMEEILYQVVPSGQKQAKLDPYGEKIIKAGNSVSRIIDVSDAGTTQVRPADALLLRWRDKNPGKAWFPAEIGYADFTNPRTKQKSKMNENQLSEFREKAGKRATALLKQQSLNTTNPTQADVDKIRNAHSKAREEVKRILSYSPSFIQLGKK